MDRKSPALEALWLACATLAMASCGVTGPNASRPLSLSVTTQSSRAAAAGVSADIQVGSGANSLTISQVQVVLARIKLATAGPCAVVAQAMTAETDNDAEKDTEDDCGELRSGPILVDLPVDGTTKVIIDALVPPGTYSALQAKVDAVEPHDNDPDAVAFLAAHPDFAGVSVNVTGVYTDANSVDHPFTYKSEVDAELEASFDPPVVVDATTSNVTVDVDVASWFKDASGAVIDPTNAANAATINRNIRQSVKSFEDDDHDGRDDHHEEGANKTGH